MERANANIFSLEPIIMKYYFYLSFDPARLYGLIFLLGSLFAMPVTASCFDSQSDQPFYEFGLALSQSGIKVHHSSGKQQHDPIGLIESDNDLSMHMSLGSPYQYFFITGKDVGYYCRIGYSNFKLTQQSGIDDPRGDNDTVKGHYFFAHPVIFLNFGDRYIQEGSVSSKIGVGVGVGYLLAKGNMLVDNRGVIEHQQLALDQLGLSYEFFVEARKDFWVARLTYSGPEVQKNGFIYTFVGTNIEFGYSIKF